MKYLLDTNICIYFLNQNEKIVNKINKTSAADLAVSIISLAELQFGAFNSQKIKNNSKKITAFQEALEIITLTPAITEKYASIKAELHKTGQPVDDFDLLIGATAIVYDLILVTNNQQHFARMKEVQLENWLE
ncbi:toxin PIN domain [Candidatus Termititenax aidoneus]|uniref:Toxin PIN domain n=1 Tax=Termititenax aidoneus TaxID=2218524 RepID=A0A388TCQ0_TERA1|nr:toxin PIN domain [Candidatus Termititenax aidoneus]